ncbi:MAG: TetR/AcrR family transcriptional regulator [Xanthomonadales bacterium]|jgi:AcrR family transcriptional regulator|nr:TetR/AcrR family transcriptional regulator [Xanthomonadales bacterium]
MRARAINDSEKQEKREAILDAAEQLLRSDPQRLAVMQALADAAGVAKGTVYLYFRSKEEVLLALHQRHVDGFFDAFESRLLDPTPVDVDAVLLIARERVIEAALYLPLCARVNSMMERELSAPVSCDFKEHVATRLVVAGALLEQRLPQVGRGNGALILMRSYAAIIGMWMLLHPIPHLMAEYQRRQFDFFQRDFVAEAMAAVRAIWIGHAGNPVQERGA